MRPLQQTETFTSTEATLERLAEDVRAAAWFLPAEDDLRGYLVMLAALPSDDDAWLEILEPWIDDLRHGTGPRLDAPERMAAAGAVGGAALRASRDLPAGSELSAALRTVARWSFFLVRPDLH